MPVQPRIAALRGAEMIRGNSGHNQVTFACCLPLSMATMTDSSEVPSMPIRLTDEQWANVLQGNEVPVRVSDPAQIRTFVLVQADVYERFKALFEEDPVTEQERQHQLEQFGRRAGWDDPAMDIYNDLDPRHDS
jgi:hypothetical protein